MIANLLKKLTSLEASVRLNNQHTYGRKSQKRKCKKTDDDGSYTIDNSIAERFIRPLAGERKNSLFFGSGKMASVSAAYHTIISTCKMQGIHILKYLKEFFKQIVLGRTDYENLLPMTIVINNNKY